MKQRDRRIAIVDFPEQVWKEDEKGDGGAQPDFEACELFSGGCEEKTYGEARAEEKHGMFVQEAQSRYSAEEKPETRAAAVLYTQNDRRARHPENGLERIHGKEVVECQIDRREKNQE